MPNINDIEPIITTNIFNLYIYLFLSLVAAILITLLVLFLRYKKSKKAPLNPYEKLDFNNANRDLLYQFSTIAKEHNPSAKLDTLLDELEEYKYSKNAKDINEQIINKIKAFIQEEQLCK